MSSATFTFGRFNPPTEEGHGKLVSAVQNHAKESGGQHYIFPTHSQDKKKNPMSHEDKVGAMHKLFPSANIVSHDKVRTVVDAMKHLESKGHKNVTMVVGSDRVDQFHKMLNDYREKEYPKIKKINVVSAGNRDPDAEGAEGMSASKLRGLVASGNKKEFISHYSDPKLGAHIHDKVKAGMQMESTNPLGIFLLGGPGSGKDYVLNNIFSRFDLTEVQIDQVINGSASELIEQKKNIVINGSIDAEKIKIVESILDGYTFDAVYVSVTNKVSRLRNSMREYPLNETKRIQKFLAVEKLVESIDDVFIFNNSINLNESSDMEKVFFGSEIEKLLARIVEHGLSIKETSEPKSFLSIRQKYVKEDIRYAEKTVFPPIESLRLHAEKIAEKHNVSPAEIIDHLAAGIAVEYRSTNNYDKALKLALKNLEKKSDYYSSCTTVEEQLQRPKVPAMRYVPSEAERIKASEQKARQHRVRHRWFDHRNSDVSRIAKEEKNPVDAIKLGTQAAKKYMHSTGDTGNPVQEKKEFPPVRHHESGLPSKYVAGLTPAEIKAKKATISRNAKLSDKDPEAYKDMPGDKRIRAKGIPLSKYTKKYHAMYGEEVEQVEEGAADTSLAAKSKKSGVSLATLRKVYNRGVAAWNSGHRPGTTPAQWGHARVNSYITHGKTYHTADKDLHEEEMVRGTNCKNCIFWKEDSEKPVGKDELNENGGLNAPNDEYVEMSKRVDLVTLPGKATSKVKAFCDNDKVNDWVTERMCCALWDGEGTKRDYKGDATFMEEVEVPLPSVIPKIKHSGGITKVKKAQEKNRELAKKTGALEEDIDLLFERQFDGTSSYREYAIAMTPGQSQEIKDVSGNTQEIDDEEQCGCGSGCDCNSIENSPTGASGNRIVRSFKDIRTGIREAKGEEKVVDIVPTIQTKRKKGQQVRPINTFDSTLQGMPTVSTAFAEETTLEEAVQYHMDNKISFTENVFRPGSDMFFELIKEAKRLYKEGKYTPADEFEKQMLQSDIGEIAEYEGQLVVLDYPIEEGLEEECWAGYTQKGMKKKGDKMVPNCVPVNEDSDPTNGHGIGKPFRKNGGGAVYVKDGDKVHLVNFSQSGMKKRFMEPGRVRSFVARHHCLTNNDKTSAEYWACRWPRYFSNSGKQWW